MAHDGRRGSPKPLWQGELVEVGSAEGTEAEVLACGAEVEVVLGGEGLDLVDVWVDLARPLDQGGVPSVSAAVSTALPGWLGLRSNSSTRSVFGRLPVQWVRR
jgi:hypothetical protein